MNILSNHISDGNTLPVEKLASIRKKRKAITNTVMVISIEIHEIVYQIMCCLLCVDHTRT
jgi:hypothetical protein